MNTGARVSLVLALALAMVPGPLLPIDGAAADAVPADHDLIQTVCGGEINWTRATACARGVQAPSSGVGASCEERQQAFEAALSKARQSLLEVVRQIRIFSGRHVGDMLARGTLPLENLRAMAADAAIADQQFLSDGTAAVTLEMSLHGGLAQLILPKEIQPIDAIRPVSGKSRASDERDASTGSATPANTPEFTGLVVDARGISVTPALIPVIQDENGQQIFGPAYASREFAVQHGMSGFYRNLKTAQQSSRVGDTPLTVKGLRTTMPARTTIIISNTDAATIRSRSAHLDFLKQCRVVIVVD